MFRFFGALTLAALGLPLTWAALLKTPDYQSPTPEPPPVGNSDPGDGFYFPISYSTSRARFAGDAKQCEQRCPSRSRLFVHRNPGEDVDNMVDLDGRPYRSLPSALLHRTRYVPDCTCRGLPWEESALARHRAYAEAGKQKIARKTADKPPAAQSKRLTRPKDRWAHSQ